MTLDDIRFIFNRAFRHTLHRKKIFWTFLVMALCGVMVVFFRGLAVSAGDWVTLSLTFMPVFLCGGVLLSAGILLIRMYHDEVKQREVKFREVLYKSWDLIIAASYFSVPIILCYMLLWMLLGIFILLSRIPAVGPFFSVILSFGPFLLNLGTLILIFLNLSLLFFLAPILALKGGNRKQVPQTLLKRFESDPFLNMYLFVISIVPLTINLGLLIGATLLTGSLCYECDTALHTVLLWFSLMVPFTAFLSPAVVFFFNFAAEAHVLLQKKVQQDKQNAAGAV